MNDELLLEYFKLTKTSEGSIVLDKTGEVGVAPVSGGGAGSSNKEKELLSEIIEKFNKKFGTDFTKINRVVSEFANDMMADEQIANAGKEGDKTAFKTLFDKKFMNMAMNRYEETTKESQETDSFFVGLFENEDKLKAFKKMLLDFVYNTLRDK